MYEFDSVFVRKMCKIGQEEDGLLTGLPVTPPISLALTHRQTRSQVGAHARRHMHTGTPLDGKRERVRVQTLAHSGDCGGDGDNHGYVSGSLFLVCNCTRPAFITL